MDWNPNDVLILKQHDNFSQEIQIPDKYNPKRVNSFLFPYIGTVAALLIEQNHPCAESVLKRCAEHNRTFLQHLEQTIEEIRTQIAKMYEPECWSNRRPSPDEIYQQSLKEITFFRKDEIVTSWCGHLREGGVTNLVSIECDSKPFRFAPMIDEINETYRKVMEYEEKCGQEDSSCAGFGILMMMISQLRFQTIWRWTRTAIS